MTAADDFVPCRMMSLEDDLLVEARRIAIDVNPANDLFFRGSAGIAAALLDPQSLAAYTGKYWRTDGVELSVSFVDPCSDELKRRILSHLNAWNTVGQVNAVFRLTNGTGQVRIGLDPRDGHYSFIGTDILSVPSNQKTMNLAVSDSTPEREMRRVVTHEGGHSLGFPHEHLRRSLVALIDPDLAYRYFAMTQGWNQQTTRNNVLTPLDERSITGSTETDPISIMCYPIPGSITRNGQPIPGGMDLSEIDKVFARKLYPPKSPPSPPPVQPPVEDEQVEIILRFRKGQKVPDYEVFTRTPDSLKN